jgi:threonine dehydratase
MQDRQNNRGKRVGLILSGGNIDFDLFRKWVGPDVAVSTEQRVAV